MMSSEALRPVSGGRKPLGKLASRLEEVKNPWRQVAGLELSHNEAARLATDALLELGENDYRRVLAEERELNFLSTPEISYITRHATKTFGPDSNGAADRDFGDSDAVSDLTSGTYFPMVSDDEPPMLELGWPDTPSRFGPSETQIYFQRDKSHNVKDLIRSRINKAKKVIALAMDVFTDVDLLCDLIEASNKRCVPVYILLDDKNVDCFIDMCSALDIQNSHLGNMRIRTVCGDTYCTKSGKKFTGQVLEKFMIIDCEEVIAGSYSFTWLSAQVHSNMVMHFSGRITESFDREFRCLYADSQVISHFNSADDDAVPCYAPYHAPLVGGAGPLMRMDLLSDRPRVASENSSSQSSNSMSSVKVAPGMNMSTVYKVTQGHDKKEPNNNSLFSSERGRQTSPNHGKPGLHTLANGWLDPTPIRESSAHGYTPLNGLEWTKNKPADFLRSKTSPKYQAFGLLEQKPGLYHGTGLANNLQGYLNTKTPSPDPEKLGHKHRASSSQFLNRLSDLFLPSTKDKNAYNLRGTGAWEAGPDLSLPEPESEQAPPPPVLSPPVLMNRQDQKRMTLGHSKLDLVNQYNKMKSRQVYSRFELKSST